MDKMDRRLARIINNINEYCDIKYIINDDNFNIYQLDKIDIYNIKKAINKIDDSNKDNIKWIQDKQYLTSLINDWCIVYRCYSLYIK